VVPPVVPGAESGRSPVPRPRRAGRKAARGPRSPAWSGQEQLPAPSTEIQGRIGPPIGSRADLALSRENAAALAAFTRKG
jgi:hypothetical protein